MNFSCAFRKEGEIFLISLNNLRVPIKHSFTTLCMLCLHCGQSCKFISTLRDVDYFCKDKIFDFFFHFSWNIWLELPVILPNPEIFLWDIIAGPHNYRMNQQCCPGGNRLETTWKLTGNSSHTSVKFVNNKLKFCIYGWNCLWFSTKSGDHTETTCGLPPDDFQRDNIAGPHGMYGVLYIDNSGCGLPP